MDRKTRFTRTSGTCKVQLTPPPVEMDLRTRPIDMESITKRTQWTLQPFRRTPRRSLKIRRMPLWKSACVSKKAEVSKASRSNSTRLVCCVAKIHAHWLPKLQRIHREVRCRRHCTLGHIAAIYHHMSLLFFSTPPVHLRIRSACHSLQINPLVLTLSSFPTFHYLSMHIAMHKALPNKHIVTSPRPYNT